jgi:type I restriction enzyme R subunit
MGDQYLRDFRDNEKTIPTILTTSHKLSTGVDALNVRNIVLMRPIRSMIEFKQIVGRGTRVFDGKDFFTIYDFVRAYEHFSDPEWDGEPLEPVAPAPRKPREQEKPDGMEAKGREFDEEPVQKVVVKLSDGRARKIQYIASTSYWFNGKVVSAREFIERLFGDLSSLVADEDELRRTWSDPAARAHFVKQLEEKGFGPGELSNIRRLIDAQDSDIFDVLAYVRFAMEPKPRAERADDARRSALPAHKGEMREFLESVLSAYEKSGVEELSLESLPALLNVKYGGLSDAKSRLGELGAIRRAFVGIQADIYRD